MHHLAVVVWRVPGNDHPLSHVGEADTARAVVAEAHLWAARAQLGDYNVNYIGWMRDASLYVHPTATRVGDGVPYQSGPAEGDRLHERLIERGDDDGDDEPGPGHYGPDDPHQ